MRFLKELGNRIEEQAKKAQGGAEKHGGYLKALNNEIDTGLRKLDPQLEKDGDAKLSGLWSNDKDKQQAAKGALGLGEKPKKPAEEKVQELEDLTLREHLEEAPLDENIRPMVTLLLQNDSSNSELAAALLPIGNQSITDAITSWAQTHISETATIEELRAAIENFQAQRAEETAIAGENVPEVVASAFALGDANLTQAIAQICLRDPAPAAEEELAAEEESDAPVNDETPAPQAQEVASGAAAEEGQDLLFPTSDSFSGASTTPTQEERMQVTGEAVGEEEFLPLNSEA